MGEHHGFRETGSAACKAEEATDFGIRLASRDRIRDALIGPVALSGLDQVLDGLVAGHCALEEENVASRDLSFFGCFASHLDAGRDGEEKFRLGDFQREGHLFRAVRGTRSTDSTPGSDCCEERDGVPNRVLAEEQHGLPFLHAVLLYEGGADEGGAFFDFGVITPFLGLRIGVACKLGRLLSQDC